MVENLEEVMVQVDEDLVETTEMVVHEMVLQETNTKRKDLLSLHLLVEMEVEIQIVKDGKTSIVFEHLKNSTIRHK
jgi:hypothetical protein